MHDIAFENFFNIDDPSQGIARQLADGIATRVFPGEQAMLSLVSCDANSAGSIHSHPEEQWGMCLEGNGVRIQDGATVLDIFAPPRAEYKKSGSGFGV